MPTWDQVATYLSALHNLWWKHKGNLVSREVMDTRFEQCKVCEHFDGRGCKLCGCCTNRKKSLFNKIAFPDEQCPDNPPRWLKEGSDDTSSGPQSE